MLAIVTLVFLVSAVFAEDPTYTTKYDNVDLDEILANDRLLTGYINCLLNLGPCTSDGKELKNNLPDAIHTGCSKCSGKQRDGSAKVMHYIIDHRPQDWERLEKIYDQSGNYKKNYIEGKKEVEEAKNKTEDESSEKENQEVKSSEKQ